MGAASPGGPTAGGPGPASGRALVDALVDDLLAESGELRAVLAGLTAADWGRATPAAGWTVTDQVTHLAYFDDAARLSVTEPERFAAEAARLAAAGDDFPDQVAARYRGTQPAEVLAWFDRARSQLTAAYRAADPAVRLPWFGPPMSLASSVTARLMETWAHGQDIVDTFGIARVPAARLRHVADLGIRALRYSYAVRGLAVPTEPIRVELTGPGGARWDWGPPDAGNRVRGTALDFCLLVTQRRHRDDTDLEVTGTVARQWMSIAQAFAGAAGPGRARSSPAAQAPPSSAAFPAPAAPRAPAAPPAPRANRQLLRFLRRPDGGRQGNGRGRPDRRAHR
jgi:uncharacterized protein (TIGR03084 family)